MKKLLLAITLCSLWATSLNAHHTGYNWELNQYWYEGTTIHCEYINVWNGRIWVKYHHRKHGCLQAFN